MGVRTDNDIQLPILRNKNRLISQLIKESKINWNISFLLKKTFLCLDKAGLMGVMIYIIYCFMIHVNIKFGC